MLDTHGAGSTRAVDDLDAVASPAQVQAMVRAARSVHVAPGIKAYLVDLAEATRRHAGLALGVSPRATMALQSAARTRAASQGRDFVAPDDVKALAAPVLEHRLVASTSGSLSGLSTGEALRDTLASVPVPVGRG